VDAHAAFTAVRPFESLYRWPNGEMDGVRPNDAGYKLLAQTVGRAMRAMLTG